VFAHPLGDGAELRPLEPWQARELSEHIDRVREHLRPWTGLADRLTDVDSARRYLQEYADEQARDTGRIYGIWVDGTLSGGALFRRFAVDDGVCELGVWIGPEVQGRGLVTRAAATLIDWAVRVRGITRIEWVTEPANVRSQAVARRLGMTLEGVQRSAFVRRGERRDAQVWALLAEEWLARGGPAHVVGEVAGRNGGVAGSGGGVAGFRGAGGGFGGAGA